LTTPELTLTNAGTTAKSITVTGSAKTEVSGGTLSVAKMDVAADLALKDNVVAEVEEILGQTGKTFAVEDVKDVTVGTVTGFGTVAVKNATLTAETAIGVDGGPIASFTATNATIDGEESDVYVGSLELTNNTTATVNNLAVTDTALVDNSKLNVTTLNMSTATLTLNKGAAAAVQGLSGDLGSVAIAPGAYLAIGSDAAIPASLPTAATLSLLKSVKLASGQALAVGASLGGNDTIVFGDGSVLVVTADAASAKEGAISSETPKTASVAAGAKLYISGLEDEGTYTILGENITTTLAEGAWTGDYLDSDSDYNLVGHLDENGWFVVDATTEPTPTPTPTPTPPTPDNANPAEIPNSVTVADVREPGGRGFLAKLLTLKGANGWDPNVKNRVEKTVDAAHQIAARGGVPLVGKVSSDAVTGSVTQRLSIASPDEGLLVQRTDGTVNRAADDKGKTGFALWIMPMYQSQSAWGMEAGNYDVDWKSDLGGITLGGDFTTDSRLRLGVNFGIGGGYLTASGDNVGDSTNRFTFWSVGAYGGWSTDNVGILADVAFTSTYNDVELETPLGNLKSDVQGYAVGGGVRGEYKFATDALDVIPHIGVRFMYLATDSYDGEIYGEKVLKGDGLDQNIWTFPIGVTFSKMIGTGDSWYVKPNLDLAVVPAAGDVKARSTTRFTNVSGTKETMDTQVVDYVSYQGMLGLDFGNDNVKFGLNYGLQLSEHTAAHGLFGKIRYEF
jgi:hypothetical protein